MASMEDRRFDLGGRSLACLDTGGGGPAIVLIHGGGDNAATWHELLPALAVHGRVVAPDLAGHGRSDDPPTDGPVTYHDDVVRLLDGLGLGEGNDGRVLLVGHSLGSPVALAVAARRSVAALVLLDGAPHAGIFGRLPPFDGDEHRRRMEAMGFGAVATPTEVERLIRASDHPEQVRRSHLPLADGQYQARPSLEETLRMAERGRRSDNPYLDLRLYADVAVPTIALQANQGNQADVRAAVDELLGPNPLVDLRWMDASHSIHWDRPDAVVDAVRELLAR
jgi:pimeloyl-ACP methyl ester carboxylesterase